MRLSRFIALALASLSTGLAYYSSILNTALPIVSFAIYALAVSMIMFAVFPANSRYWKLYSIGFVIFGVSMSALAIASAALHFPIGFSLLMLIVGISSVAGWLATQQGKRRHRMARLNASYFMET